MQSRGRQPNLSFVAFTATPKGKTLELFGRTGGSGKAMVVTSSRLHAVRYKLAFDSYLAENGYTDIPRWLPSAAR